MRFSEFTNKDVVSVDNGVMLGQVNDLDFDENYRIRILYVSARPCGFRRMLPWLFANEEHMIRVDEIVRIGKDVILVQVC